MVVLSKEWGQMYESDSDVQLLEGNSRRLFDDLRLNLTIDTVSGC